VLDDRLKKLLSIADRVDQNWDWHAVLGLLFLTFHPLLVSIINL